MKPIEFDVELKAGELYRFTMRHTYYSFAGILGLIISFGAIVLAVINRAQFAPSTLLVLAFVGILFPVVQPVMLYFKCKMQIKKSESINAPLHYILSDDGITIRQKEQEVQVKWYHIRRVVDAKSGLYLYMTAMRAFIFPRAQCAEQYEAIRSAVLEKFRQYRDYEPEDGLENISERTAQEEEANAAAQEGEEKE